MTDNRDRKQLAFEILGMTYGEFMAMGDSLSDILANDHEATTGPEIAASLYAWAEAENEPI